MSLVKLFSDELSQLNNRESLYKIHLPRTESKIIFEAPPHNIGTDNLLVFVNGNLKSKELDYNDFSSNAIEFKIPILNTDTIIIFLIRTGADYTYGNTAIAQFHHSLGDPPAESGKNDDYHLNITTGDLFSKTNGMWVKIFSIGSGSGGGGSTDIGIAPFCRLIYQSLSFERIQNVKIFEIPSVNISAEIPLVYINGFLMVYGRDYTIVDGKFLKFEELITLDKDVTVYKAARKIAGGNFDILFSLLNEERVADITSVTFSGDFKPDYEKELVFLNGFLLINGRDYTILNKTVIFNFTIKKEWDIVIYKIGEGEIFGFADLGLVSPKDTRQNTVNTLNLNFDIYVEKDSLFCFLNGFLLAKERDYTMINQNTIQFTFDLEKDKDIVIYRWTNRIKPPEIEWKLFAI